MVTFTRLVLLVEVEEEKFVLVQVPLTMAFPPLLPSSLEFLPSRRSAFLPCYCFARSSPIIDTEIVVNRMNAPGAIASQGSLPSVDCAW